MAGVALYASLFQDGVKQLDLVQLPKSHAEGPELLNVMRILDLPQTVAMAAERARVRLFQSETNGWNFPSEIISRLGWTKTGFQVKPL